MSAWFKGPILKPFSDRCFSSQSPVSTMKSKKKKCSPAENSIFIPVCTSLNKNTLASCWNNCFVGASVCLEEDTLFWNLGCMNSISVYEPFVTSQGCDLHKCFSYTLSGSERSKGEFTDIESNCLKVLLLTTSCWKWPKMIFLCWTMFN